MAMATQLRANLYMAWVEDTKYNKIPFHQQQASSLAGTATSMTGVDLTFA